MRDQRETVLLEWNSTVGIEQIRLMLIDEILDPLEVAKLPCIGRSAAHGLGRLREIGRHVGVAVIEIRVVRIRAVVGHPGVRA
jgi:hypothetical protein